MAALGSQSIASSYEQLLHVDNDGGGNGTTHVSIKDGDNGTTFGFTIATDALMMSSTNRLEFGDTGTYIHQSADGVLDLVSDTEIEINATTIDINGAVAMDGAMTGGTNITISGELDAATLDISGDADIDGTLEADAITVAGTALATFIRDTVGTNMLSSNTESGITVTYDTTNDNIDFAVDASQTGLTSILNTSLVAGRDADNQIKFSTDNEIIFRVSGGDGVTMKASGEIEATSLDISGDADIDGTLEADAITIGGTTLAETISDTVGAMVGSNTETGIAVTYEDGDNTLDFALGASQTTLTSILNASLVAGRDADNQIKFSTDDQIIFRVGGGDGVTMKASGEIEATSLDVSGDIDIDGTANLDAVDIDGAVDMASTLAVGGNLTVQPSSGDVTAFIKAPGSTTLTMNTTGTTDHCKINFGDSGDDNIGIIQYNNNGNNMVFTTNASEALRIDSAGNMGLGDTDPSEAKLSIDNVQSGDVGINLKNTQATTALKIDQDGNGSSINIDSESTDQDVIFIDTASTSGKALHIDANFLTNGMIVDINSNSSDNTARTLVSIINDHTSAANTTAMKITQDADTTGLLVDTTHSSFAGNGTVLKATGRSKNSGFNFLTTKTGGDTEDVHHLVGDGTVVADGAYSSGGADYAEYFESKDGKAIAVGTTIKLDGDKIVACEDGDTPIGVVRPYGNSVVIGNSAPLKWDNKYQKDDYGADIMEEYSVTEWIEETDEINTEAVEKVLYVEGDNIPEGKEIGDVKIEAKAATYKTKDVQYQTDKIPSDVKVPSDATIASTEKDGTKLMRRKLNSDYDENKTYIPRKKRDEWCLVGLIGQIPITKGQPMASNWIKMKDISNSVEMYLVK